MQREGFATLLTVKYGQESIAHNSLVAVADSWGELNIIRESPLIKRHRQDAHVAAEVYFHHGVHTSISETHHVDANGAVVT